MSLQGVLEYEFLWLTHVSGFHSKMNEKIIVLLLAPGVVHSGIFVVTVQATRFPLPHNLTVAEKKITVLTLFSS